MEIASIKSLSFTVSEIICLWCITFQKIVLCPLFFPLILYYLYQVIQIYISNYCIESSLELLNPLIVVINLILNVGISLLDRASFKKNQQLLWVWVHLFLYHGTISGDSATAGLRIFSTVARYKLPVTVTAFPELLLKKCIFIYLFRMSSHTMQFNGCDYH